MGLRWEYQGERLEWEAESPPEWICDDGWEKGLCLIPNYTDDAAAVAEFHQWVRFILALYYKFRERRRPVIAEWLI